MVTTAARRFTIEEYHRLAELGILTEDSGVELLDGAIIMKHPADGGGPRPYRFTHGQRARMEAVGLLARDEEIETTDGEGEEVAAIGRRHNRAVNMLTQLLVMQKPPGTLVQVQGSIRMGNGSEPEPDLAAIRDLGPDGPMTTEADVLLVIEVAESSLYQDRAEKLPRYARAGIPEAWIVNVSGGDVTRYTAPHNGRYRTEATVQPGETLASTTAPEIALPTADTLI